MQFAKQLKRWHWGGTEGRIIYCHEWKGL